MKAYTYNDRLVGVGNDQILGTDQGGGSKEYYAGQYISIDENDVISVTGLAPVSAIPDVSDMATKTWVGEQGYLTEVPSIYATDTEVYEATVTAINAVTGNIGGDNVFIAEYGRTTQAELLAAWQANKEIFVHYRESYGNDYNLALNQHPNEWNTLFTFSGELYAETGYSNSGYKFVVIDFNGERNPNWRIKTYNYDPLQVQANWNESNSSSKAYIQNKPSIPTFTEGNCIDITSNAISWETTAGVTDIVSVSALPANPVATVIYLIPET